MTATKGTPPAQSAGQPPASQEEGATSTTSGQGPQGQPGGVYAGCTHSDYKLRLQGLHCLTA